MRAFTSASLITRSQVLSIVIGCVRYNRQYARVFLRNELPGHASKVLYACWPTKAAHTLQFEKQIIYAE